ncbi:MAG: type II toxin-antitoxin system RelE/ParE family toxin [Bacteriovoracales bacterium]|nr:type II toxin-antitoxin system RelE/ParE family toxin [Bacteriovoracales bacterium]
MARIISKETREIRQDLRDVLEKLERGFRPELPHIRPLSSIHFGLYEIRVRDKKGEFRAIYFVKIRDAIYILHAFRKKTQKMPQKEKNVILKRIREIN